ncbi:hypothetical protein G4B88_015457 [Cannabis sativa]|uniref:RNase H type-1 domain-containing protein n=1 Tax=Cannabis sativa TaxID=3483 RepID=A0A7J6DPL3_CANSA|nr:hypothetical protein G4B88_015457 [Cannabis sativa]
MGLIGSTKKRGLEKKDELWSWIWNSKVHPRMSLILWRVCSSVLPTGDKFLPLEANTCPVCHMAPESAIHLFAKCSFATALWFSSPMPIRIDRVAGANMQEVIHNLCSSFDFSLRPKLLNCIGVILDCIWNTRNKVYDSVDYMPNVNLIRGEVFSRVSELCQVVEANLSLSNNHEGETSPRISTNTFIMVDGSFKDGTYGCAMVALDKGYMEWWQCTSSGEGESALEAEMQAILISTNTFIMVDGSFKDGTYGCAMVALDKGYMEWWQCTSSGEGESALEAEMQAILVSLQWAFLQQWDNFTIISDSKVLVEAIRAKKAPAWNTRKDEEDGKRNGDN